MASREDYVIHEGNFICNEAFRYARQPLGTLVSNFVFTVLSSFFFFHFREAMRETIFFPVCCACKWPPAFMDRFE